MKQSPLSRVENLIRRVMEEPFTWFGSESLDPFQLARYLTRTYEELERNETPPNQFILYISPEDHRELNDTLPGLEKQVADYVVLMTVRNGVHLDSRPQIQFEIDPDQKSNSARIVAARVEDGNDQFNTAILTIDSVDTTQEAIREADAFLILQGRRHIPLDRPVIRIGRRVDNDIVLDTPSISRQHVQIRWRQRYFVLYDVSSRGRTTVNGEAIHEHILRPGDVIALSDVFLVYGEGREDIVNPLDSSTNEEMGSTLLKPD